MNRVAVGLIVTKGMPVPGEFLRSWTRMLQVTLSGAGNALLPAERQITSMNVIHDEDFPIDFARNEVCRIFLDKDAASDALLFLDIDMTHPPDMIHRLYRHNVDVVSARYVLRKPPFFTCAMRKVGDGPRDYQAVEKLLSRAQMTGLVPIDGGGAGALMISRHALETMREHLGDDEWFRYQDGPAGKRSISEDMWFYEQARACALQPLLDADCWCQHQSSTFVGPSDHEPYREAFARANAQPTPQEVPA